MARQNLRLTDPVVGEKPIGSLGVRPILAHQRNAFAHGAPDLRHQLAEPLVQALVGEAAACELAIKPCACFSVHWHRPPRIGARQGITVDSCGASATSAHSAKMWVIESVLLPPSLGVSAVYVFRAKRAQLVSLYV